MRNFFERLVDWPAGKEKTDMLMRTWKVEHSQDYALFKQRISLIGRGDLSIMEEMFLLAKSCIPETVISFHELMSKTVCGKGDANELLKGIREMTGDSFTPIVECLANGQLWLAMNLKTGIVKVAKDKQHGCIMLRSGTPMEIWNRLPQSMRTYLCSQIDKLLKNNKGIFMFSKLERKMAYQAIAYFSRIAFLGCAVFMGDFMANLYDKVIEEKCQLAYCMYYFVVFDHGLACMAKQLDELLKCEQADQEGLLLIKDCVRMLVCQSLSMGVESKARWEQTADKCSPEIWKEIAFILRHGQGKRGNRKRIMTLDEMLTGDIRQAKQDIRKFLSENTDDISLAYLLVSLTRAQRIKPSVRYMTFHRAIEQFARRKYGHDIPQKRYGEIKELGLKEPQRGASYTRAKKIVDKWTEIF